MNLSFWEQQTWFTGIDHLIVGSGIVGLSCALALRQKYPRHKIVVVEQGVLPSGASTKNAGFACFGSVSEILDDLQTHTEEEVIALVRQRKEGLARLRSLVGDAELDYQQHGGYELFLQNDQAFFENSLDQVSYVSKLLKSTVFNEKEPFLIKNTPFSFKNVQKKAIFNPLEGQLDTGGMMRALIQSCSKNDVFILNSTKIASFLANNGQILVKTDKNLEFTASNLFITTNGFASELMDEPVKPARAQVLITSPIDELDIKGTFHIDRGYNYFRNVGNRILLGGGRHLDKEGETTSKLEVTSRIQDHLETLLRTTILPGKTFDIETRWSGIMGVGPQKKPIVKEVKPQVYCGVRMGGMGVALGSSIGYQLASFV